MRVSLAPAHLRRPLDAGLAPTPAPTAMLTTSGPRVILGGEIGADGLAQQVEPRADTLFGPRGACLASPAGPLYVCDTGHHRLLAWSKPPTADQTPADMVIGQPDFFREGRNAKSGVGATTLNVPTGIAADAETLVVADAWNHRVLIWHGHPDRSNRPADVVLGQADFTGGLANRGTAAPRADTLNWCYGVAIADGRLFVADTGNRRMLVWDTIPTRNSTPADLVLGQTDFTTRDENAGAPAGASGMRWPHTICVADGMVLVPDAGNNRVMVWRQMPTRNGAPCDFVLGQTDVTSVDHNRAAYYPTATAMSMPYGLTRQGDRIAVADTANSRLVGFEIDVLDMGADATSLTGQRTFEAKGDNRWGPPVRDSLCWPYGVAACGETLIIADSGNSRVLLWEAAP